MFNLYLGVVLNKDGKIVNHRSLLKILVNPILRTLGFQISSVVLNNLPTGYILHHFGFSLKYINIFKNIKQSWDYVPESDWETVKYKTIL